MTVEASARRSFAHSAALSLKRASSSVVGFIVNFGVVILRDSLSPFDNLAKSFNQVRGKPAYVFNSVWSVIEFESKELFSGVGEVVDNLNLHRKSAA